MAPDTDIRNNNNIAESLQGLGAMGTNAKSRNSHARVVDSFWDTADNSVVEFSNITGYGLEKSITMLTASPYKILPKDDPRVQILADIKENKVNETPVPLRLSTADSERKSMTALSQNPNDEKALQTLRSAIYSDHERTLQKSAKRTGQEQGR
jgi:hypothetical protein